jgi:hypothetical protein
VERLHRKLWCEREAPLRRGAAGFLGYLVWCGIGLAGGGGYGIAVFFSISCSIDNANLYETFHNIPLQAKNNRFSYASTKAHTRTRTFPHPGSHRLPRIGLHTLFDWLRRVHVDVEPKVPLNSLIQPHLFIQLLCDCMCSNRRASRQEWQNGSVYTIVIFTQNSIYVHCQVSPCNY